MQSAVGVVFDMWEPPIASAICYSEMDLRPPDSLDWPTRRRFVKGYLVRVGVDQIYGRWNAPVDPATGEFVYVPIPDDDKKLYMPSLKREYSEFVEHLSEFSRRFPKAHPARVTLPRALLKKKLHLDPDFKYLTYGDNGAKRGAGISKLERDDLVVFYAGLRPITARACLVYALIGILVVDEVIAARTVETARRMENAHTRWNRIAAEDIVVRGRRLSSGRFDRCVPIGEFRARAYRVRAELEKAWGGLSVKNGYIQRSAVPPAFLDPQRFFAWLREQDLRLLRRNN